MSAPRVIALSAPPVGRSALALLRVLQDGQKVDFPRDEERFDITPIDMLPGFRRSAR